MLFVLFVLFVLCGEEEWGEDCAAGAVSAVGEVGDVGNVGEEEPAGTKRGLGYHIIDFV